jgi:hypothetical protein
LKKKSPKFNQTNITQISGKNLAFPETHY